MYGRGRFSKNFLQNQILSNQNWKVVSTPVLTKFPNKESFVLTGGCYCYSKFLSICSDAKDHLVESFLLFIVGILVWWIFVVIQEWHVFVVFVANRVCFREDYCKPIFYSGRFYWTRSCSFSLLIEGFST